MEILKGRIVTDFIIKALLAGIGISIISGPIGSLMIWQRMTYFGDTIAHASLLGISIATMFNINIYYGLIFTCVIIGIILTILATNKKFTNDTTLSILSHSVFAAGLVAASLLKNTRVDLFSFLCGDILSVTNYDLILIFIVDIIVLIGLSFLWEKLVFITINRELAIVDGIKESQIRWIFILLVSLIFAVSIRLVGILLINGLLLIPCSIAKIWSKSPTQMAILGSICGCLTIILGIIGSLLWNAPTGPTIVVSAGLLFMLNILIKTVIKKFFIAH